MKLFGTMSALLITAVASTAVADNLLTTQVPSQVNVKDGVNYELGMRFQVSAAGSIESIRFYKGSKESGKHIGKIYSSSGALLAQVTFANESVSGWQSQKLVSALKIEANKEYVVSVNTPNQYYVATNNGFKSIIKNGKISSMSGANGVYGAVGKKPSQSWKNSNYFRDVIFVADSGTNPNPSPTPVETPKPSPTPVQTPDPVPTPMSGFPNASNTGVPAGTVLSNYTGPCTITVANTVIDAKTINCSLTIRASGVVIKRSKINGSIDSGDDKTTGYSFRVEDSEIDATPGFAAAVTALGSVNFTVIRTHVYGGNRGANCWYNCLIQDSYFHGQDTDNSGVWHESGIRMGMNGTIRHNTIICDAPDVPPDAGCSAALTGYGDFGPVQNMLIENNLFPPTTGGFCSYGGSSKGKPYSNDAANIVFKDNVYQKGTDGRLCGYWGPITDFDISAPGNQWINNTWQDGSIIKP